MNRRRTALAALCLFTVPLCLAPAAPSMSFRNNLLPGFLTRHKIARTIRRSIQRPDHLETLIYSKTSDWVRCNVSESRPGQVKVYQMMSDHPTRVLKFFRGERQIEPTPDAGSFSLIEGTTSLFDDTMTPLDAPIVAPRTELAERAIVQAMMDVAHWPRPQIETGHRWQRDLDLDGFKGTQTLEFTELGKSGGETAARLTVDVEGQFTGALEREFTLGKVQAAAYWSRGERCLIKLEGQASYQRKREGVVEDYDLKTTVSLDERRMLDDAQQESTLAQLNAFASALSDLPQSRSKSAAACADFRRRWPGSVWLPAVDALEARATHRTASAGKLTASQLDEALSKSFLAWQAAEQKKDADLKERTRKALVQMATDYRARLKNLLADKDDSVRGRAAFALAFGPRPADLALVQKAARDTSTTVRAPALIGLIARRDPQIDSQLLAGLLGDGDKSIRRLACDAIAACIARENPAVATLVETLDNRLQHDRASAVRIGAVRAIAAIGAPVDVPRLEKALKSEAEVPVREEIQKAIPTLRDRR